MDLVNSIESLDYKRMLEPLETLRNCHSCPWNCNADRFSGKLGHCKADTSFSISSICIHRGEEPAISGAKGICNIFFTSCNMQCIYCQNYQISCNTNNYEDCRMELKEVLNQIVAILATGINHVGFVSPSHFVPQMKVIVTALREIGLNPVFVYNTNGYDKPETIREIEYLIDVYLPDFKYSDSVLAHKYSGIPGYPEIALAAIKEMHRQKGTALPLDDHGYALQGIVIRHLVLPGYIENSLNVLRTIASDLSPDIHLSLMSQYYPTHKVMNDEFLSRALNRREYQRVVDLLDELCFTNGWIQDLGSQQHYRPDFEKEHPFKK